jgi:hypothetical protein
MGIAFQNLHGINNIVPITLTFKNTNNLSTKKYPAQGIF